MHDGSVGIGGKLTGVVLGGDPRPAEANEMGWKDTAVMLPGEVTRVIAKFDRTGRYVWHCHILSHEDHEMMRPFQVGPMMMAKAGSASFNSVTSEDKPSNGNVPRAVVLGQNQPNPFTSATQIRFSLAEDGPVELTIYNIAGQKVRTLVNRSFGQGDHFVDWDGKDTLGNTVASGVYFYRFNAGASVQIKKMVFMR